ncbi:protein KRBA1 isoform X2 [Phasianus colchicus]|uniref:protein KRBA1 isoform X2 n=1 Tax=Phasianus colchicus TaxID=9054 RepID=UPI00129DCA98|nr:protein KRBA1 isoform X2 [Phasianus colchicus]
MERPMAVPRQVLVTLEEVTVCFSVEEWALLEEWQRELHREVTAATEQLLASLDADGPQDAATGQEPRGPPSSASLCALVRLVRDIPQFLFGSSNGAGPRAAAGGDMALRSELLGAGGEAQAAPENSNLNVLERAVPSWHGSPSSTAPMAPHWVKPEVLAESSPLWSVERCLEELPRGDPCPPRTPSSSEGQQAELGGLCSHGGGSIGHSPLQGLLDCLRAITIPTTSCHSPLGASHGTRGAVEPSALRNEGQSPSAAGKALVTPRFHQMEISKWMSMNTSIGDTGREEQRGLEMSPVLDEAPLRSLLRCLRSVAVQAPCRNPVGAALALSGAEASPQHCPSAGTTVSLAENCVLGDSCTDGSTWLCARVPAMGTATKRPSLGGTKRSPCSSCSTATGALRATSPLGSSTHPRTRPGRVPASPRKHCGCGGTLELRAELAQLRTAVAEKLHRLRRDVGTAQREVLGVRSRLARLEQGARGRARDVAALIRSRRRLRDAIRRLEGRCWALESRAWRGSCALPDGSDAVTILQMVLPAVLGLALPRCGSGAANSSAAPQDLGAL